MTTQHIYFFYKKNRKTYKVRTDMDISMTVDDYGGNEEN